MTAEIATAAVMFGIPAACTFLLTRLAVWPLARRMQWSNRPRSFRLFDLVMLVFQLQLVAGVYSVYASSSRKLIVYPALPLAFGWAVLVAAIWYLALWALQAAEVESYGKKVVIVLAAPLFVGGAYWLTLVIMLISISLLRSLGSKELGQFPWSDLLLLAMHFACLCCGCGLLRWIADWAAEQHEAAEEEI